MAVFLFLIKLFTWLSVLNQMQWEHSWLVTHKPSVILGLSFILCLRIAYTRKDMEEGEVAPTIDKYR